jgi:hypothetical protein
VLAYKLAEILRDKRPGPATFLWLKSHRLQPKSP